MAAAALTPFRRAALAAIHAGAKSLGMADDSYRDMMQRLTGKRSAKDVPTVKLQAVLDELRAKGAQLGSAPAKPGTRPKRRSFAARNAFRPAADREALWRKVQALCTALGHDERYADGIARKRFGVDASQFCDAEQLQVLVGALSRTARSRGVCLD